MKSGKEIGTTYEGDLIYDFGSKFFAITEKAELLKKDFSLLSKEPFALQGFSVVEDFAYIMQIKETESDEILRDIMLDDDLRYVNGHEISVLDHTIEGETYEVFTSEDSESYEEQLLVLDEDSEEYKKYKSVFFLFNYFNVLDVDEDIYCILVLYKNTFAYYIEDRNTLLKDSGAFAIGENNPGNEEHTAKATSALYADFEMYCDRNSYKTFKEFEDEVKFNYIRKINNITLEDVSQTTIAKVLGKNNKTISNSKDKEKYLKLYKQELIELILS